MDHGIDESVEVWPGLAKLVETGGFYDFFFESLNDWGTFFMSDEDVDFTKIRNGFQKTVEDDFTEETSSSGNQDVFILVKFEKDHCK